LNGYFYVFSDTSGLSIYDPVAQTVVKNIPDTAQQWGDAVFIRDQAQIKHYAFIADTGDPAAAPGNAYGKMYVYETELQKLVSRVDIGLRPVRVYAVPQRDEVHLFFKKTVSHVLATTTVYPCFSLPRAFLLPSRCCPAGVGASGRPRRLRRVPHVVGAVPQFHGRRQ